MDIAIFTLVTLCMSLLVGLAVGRALHWEGRRYPPVRPEKRLATEEDRADAVIDRVTDGLPAVTTDEVDDRLAQIQGALWPERRP